MLCVPAETNLPLLARGGSGHIYQVNDSVILKSPLVYEPLSVNACQDDVDEYNYQLVYSHDSIETERRVFERLPPHRNVIKALATNYHEGIYLERHEPIESRLVRGLAFSTRVRWYHDMIAAIDHFHRSDLVHTDVRLANLLCDRDDRIVLCDLASTQSIGTENQMTKVDDHGLVDINGLSATLSDATDRYAVASVIFHLETGTEPRIEAPFGTPVFPAIHVENQLLCRIIAKAWNGDYKSTGDMLDEMSILVKDQGVSVKSSIFGFPTSADIGLWRSQRLQAIGQS